MPQVWHNSMNAGVCNMHSTNCLLSKCFLCLYGCAIHTLPILRNVTYLTRITMQFHCIPQWYVLCFTCIFSNCCLQYASVLQAGIIFQAINWLLFFYNSEKKGPLLVVIVIKQAFTTTQNTKPLHIYARQTITNCLLWHYSLTVYHLLVLVATTVSVSHQE